MLHKRPLLRNGQSVSNTGVVVRVFLDFCHNAIGWIVADDVITNRQLKCRMQKRVNAFQRIDLNILSTLLLRKTFTVNQENGFILIHIQDNGSPFLAARNGDNTIIIR